MSKVLLVDDEYMITEGLKKLIPFDHWNMEVVATAEDADQALDYVREHPVDVVITDVNMPGKTGLQMIAEMKDLIPDAAFIIMSGYQDFEYVKTALNLRVADYLLKPVNKVEMGNILEFCRYIAGRNSLWIGVAKEKKGFISSSYQVLGQNLQLFISDQEEEAMIEKAFEPPYKEHFHQFKDLVERSLFYGATPLNQDEEVFHYYEPAYRVIMQGNIQQILEELDWLEKMILEKTPKVSLTKQLFIQFLMDVFHLFEYLQGDDLADVVKKVQEAATFSEMISFIQEELSRFLSHYRMNENVASVLQVISRDYQKELSLKDISQALFINPVYLGQLIKRETNATFAELLNKQRIKAAQQLLLSTNDSIEDICYKVGYSNVGYFYKVFRKLCGKSPKTYRLQVMTEQAEDE